MHLVAHQGSELGLVLRGQHVPILLEAVLVQVASLVAPEERLFVLARLGTRAVAAHRRALGEVRHVSGVRLQETEDVAARDGQLAGAAAWGAASPLLFQCVIEVAHGAYGLLLHVVEVGAAALGVYSLDALGYALVVVGDEGLGDNEAALRLLALVDGLEGLELLALVAAAG